MKLTKQRGVFELFEAFTQINVGVLIENDEVTIYYNETELFSFTYSELEKKDFKTFRNEIYTQSEWRLLDSDLSQEEKETLIKIQQLT